MTEIERIAKKEGVSTRTVYRWLEGAPRRKVSTSHMVSFRATAANWKRLEGYPNRSETINQILQEYFG